MYTLDTNTLIYYFKGMGDVAENMLAIPPKDISIPSIVLYELRYDILKSTSPKKRITQLKSLTDIIQILPFGINEANQAAIIRADLEKKGIPIGPYDLLIAGTAIAANKTLVTHNVKEFSRVKNLSCIDWY